MRGLAAVAIVCVLSLSDALSAQPPVDEDAAQPPIGRSLFDALYADPGSSNYRIPFPFEHLVSDLQGRTRAGATGTAGVLIPLGRSLQRNAALTAPFRYPRVVLAVVDGPNKVGAAMLKDRFYVGYQELSNTLEIISYNEAAGRFEFQVVHDYRAGARPRVFYANRPLCLACHQNAAPLFSRPSWDETSANPRIADALIQSAPQFHGITVTRGTEAPNAIDNAIDRANLLAPAQRIWREACALNDSRQSAQCRRDIFAMALGYRLSGRLSLTSPNARTLTQTLSQQGTQLWPEGLVISDPDIPDRDPFAVRGDAGASLIRLADVTPGFDPLVPRRPLARWRLNQADDQALFLRAIAGFLSDTDIRALERQLAASTAPRRQLSLSCDIRVGQFDCRTDTATATPLALRGELDRVNQTGTLDSFREASTELMNSLGGATSSRRTSGSRSSLEFQPRHNDLAVRLGDGAAVELFRLHWRHHPAKAELIVRDDNAVLGAALNALRDEAQQGRDDGFSDRPFRRSALMPALLRHLGGDKIVWCCHDERTPTVVAEQPTADAEVQNVSEWQPFLRNCFGCHGSPTHFPPGFLAGTRADVSAALDRCAERMLFRLEQWQHAPASRRKTPMPPSRFADEDFTRQSDYAVMRDYLKARIAARGSSLSTWAYADLPACTPTP